MIAILAIGFMVYSSYAPNSQVSILAGAVGVSSSEIFRESFENKFYERFGIEIIDDVLDWILSKINVYLILCFFE